MLSPTLQYGKQSNKTFACKCRYSKMDRCCRLGNGLVKLCVHIQVDNLCRPSGYRNSMYTISFGHMEHALELNS